MQNSGKQFEGSTSHLEGLNEPQKKAVLATDGPLLILAGAGAGKTKTLTHRMLHLTKNGVAPHSILAITFTNKAAKEMRERIRSLIASDASLNSPISTNEVPFVSTFHALGVHILRSNAVALGIPKHFTIFDRADSKKAVKDAETALGIDPKAVDPAKVLGIISREKGNMVTSEQYEERAPHDYTSQCTAKIWPEYERILRREKAVDFDDLLLKTALLLQNNAEVRTHYQNLWKYIHIDEYQDTNEVQYNIAKILAAKHNNLCVVGDVDQNIYSWRGATIKNILHFEKDYPHAQEIVLEQNYRSTKTILKAANDIITKNVNRKEKNLFTENDWGDKISLLSLMDEVHEAKTIAEKIGEIVKKGTDPSEIAVLYRANFQSRILEEAFLYSGLKYQVLGTRFFDRREIKDMMSYIKSALNKDDLTSLSRIINMPTRGIGKVTFLKMCEGKEDELNAGAKAKVELFRKFMTQLEEKIQTTKTSEVLKFIMEKTGFEAEMQKDKANGEERIENIRELVSLSTKYDGIQAPDGTLKLLEEAALASDQDDLEKDNGGTKLMTVHASKGLEFDYVFIAGLEEGLFPHESFGEKGRDEEEERRLFYVAITRARKKVFLSHASMRTIFGEKQIHMQSQFIGDIDDDLFEVDPDEPPAGEKREYLIDF